MKIAPARFRTRSQSRALGRLLVFAAAFLVAGCASIRYDAPRPPSYAIDDPQQTELGRSFATQLSSTPGMSGFRLVHSGQEAFLARAGLAEAAQRTLDLQYYMVAEDTTSTLLLYRVLLAAQRGVRVRLLIDDLDVGDRDAHLASLAAWPNVEVRVFNPFARRGATDLGRVLDYLADGTRLNRRMHNKLWIADNAAALIGGRNLSDAYFNANSESNFADLDVLLAGPLVAEASRSFDEYWNSEWAVPIQTFTGPTHGTSQSEQLMSDLAARAAAFHGSDYVREMLATGFGPQVRSGEIALIAAQATVLHDSPSGLHAQVPDQERLVVSRLHEVLSAAKEEVVLITPYFVPQQRGTETLCDLTRRGVKVRVLTNSLASTDVAAVHAAYARYRPQLLACGVVLHELRPVAQGSGGTSRMRSSGVSLHAKAVMVDRKSIVIGSMNLDPRSRLSNTEVAVLIDSAALGNHLGRWFEEAASLDRAYRPSLSTTESRRAPLAWTVREGDQLHRYASEPQVSWWQRFVSRLLGALIPEHLL